MPWLSRRRKVTILLTSRICPAAYVPDLPGCVATGDTVAAVEIEIRDAIRFHIEGLEADGIAVPQPTSIAEYVET